MALDTAGKRYSAVNVGNPWRGLNYIPSGTIDAAERLAIAYLGSSIGAEAPVEVPDVVGETQAAGTATLEGAGFVVSVTTAYSDSVAEGLIISQSPEGGEFAASGSTVTITVSLGPQIVDEQPTGGWLFLNEYEAEQQRRKARERRRRLLEEETEQIEDPLDREIAQLIRRQEAKDERREEIRRTAELARANADLEAARQYSAAVAAAFQAAIERGTTSAVDRLERELKKAREEEEFLMLAMLMVLD